MIRSRDALEAHLKRGGLVRLQYVHEPEPKRLWSVPASGEPIHGSAARWAYDAGKLAPMDDGLFPGEAQTFKAA